MFPPHTPPPASSLTTYRTWQRIKFIFTVTFLGLFAGAAASCMILGWVGPRLGGGTTILSYYRTLAPPAPAATALDAETFALVKSKSVRIYRTKTIVTPGTSYLDPRDMLGEGVVLSSDGWFALPAPNVPEKNPSWYALTPSGAIAPVTMVVYHSEQKIVYGKINAPFPLRPIEFGDAPTVGEQVAVLSSVATQSAAVERFTPQTETVLTTNPSARFRLNAGTKQAAVVDTTGRFIGLVNADGMLIENAVITELLPVIFTGKLPLLFTLGVQGWFADDVPIFSGDEDGDGFLVTAVTAKNHFFKKGDLITRLNGQIVRRGGLWYTGATTSVEAEVIRDAGVKKVSAKLSPL